MANVTSTVTINHVNVDMITKDVQIAFRNTADALMHRVRAAQVIPRDIGNLQGESFFVDETLIKKGEINLVHSTPYARRLYFHPEYDFKTDKNANAQGKWFAKWLKGGEEEDYAALRFAAFMQKEMNKR